MVGNLFKTKKYSFTRQLKTMNEFGINPFFILEYPNTGIEFTGRQYQKNHIPQSILKTTCITIN